MKHIRLLIKHLRICPRRRIINTVDIVDAVEVALNPVHVDLSIHTRPAVAVILGFHLGMFVIGAGNSCLPGRGKVDRTGVGRSVYRTGGATRVLCDRGAVGQTLEPKV